MPRTRQDSNPLAIEVDQLEDLPVPIVAYGRDLKAGAVLPYHSHRRAQFVYASSGVMTVTTPAAAYVVPPQRAVWMPGGVMHQIDARSDVAMRSLYIETTQTKGLPTEVCVLQVAPLLRELVVAAVASGPAYELDSPQSRILDVVLDQIRVQPMVSLALPMPTDPRLCKITQALIDEPSDERDLDEWASVVGASKRTLTRLFPAQTGMTFRTWRQQRRLLRALELLAAGDNVTTVALELGYDNTSAFIAMFRRCLGQTPTQYLGNSQGEQ